MKLTTVIGAISIVASLTSIVSCRQTAAPTSGATASSCIQVGQTIDDACAIQIAKTEIVHRQGTMVYSRFTASYDVEKHKWRVMAIFEPEKPGGHAFVLLDDHGNVIDYEIGR